MLNALALAYATAGRIDDYGVANPLREELLGCFSRDWAWWGERGTLATSNDGLSRDF